MAESIAFEEFSGFPKLFQTYCTDFGRLKEHFAGDWSDPEEYLEAADRAAHHPRNRKVLTTVLEEQNAAWGAQESSIENVRRLGESDAVAVVTGQQVGLFGGPLYTLLKTITTIKLADELEMRLKRPVIPVFWLEGEDHDLEEIATTWLFRRNASVGLSLDKPNRGRSVGSLRLDSDDEVLIDRLEEILPHSDFRDQVLTAVRETYQAGHTLLEAFARLMHHLFPDMGLVCMDASDKRLKQEVAPLFERELQEHAESSRRLQETSERLRDDFHTQVETSPTNLFMIDEGRRVPVEATNGSFKNKQTGSQLASADLLSIVRQQPETLSPNVVLRPLVQDSLLPTVAYVAGPGEVSYFAQFKSLYEWADLPMPLIFPRASATIIESKVQKVLDKFEIDVSDLEGDIEPLFEEIVRGIMQVDIEAAFSELTADIHKAVNAVKPKIEQVDRTLGPSTEATRAAISHELSDLEDRVIKAEKRTQDEVREQLEKARINLFPNGKLQERVINPIYFFNKYGLSFVEKLHGELSLNTSAHQLVKL